MSEHVDARFLRDMVRELASAEPKPIDWDSAEDRLFARLDEIEANGGHASEAGLAAADFAASQMIDEASSDSGLDEAALGERISEISLGAVDFSDAPSGSGQDEADRASLPYVAAMLTPSTQSSRPSQSSDLREEPRRRVITHVPAIAGRWSDVHFDSLSQNANDADAAVLPVLDADTSAQTGSGDASARGLAKRVLRRWSMVAAVAAVAACVAFVLGGLVSGERSSKAHSAQANASDVPEITAERWVDPSDVPMVPGMSGTHDLSALRAGDMVEASAGAVSFAQADKVSWTLSPGSRVFVRSGIESARHVLILESGSIRAQVLAPAVGVIDPFVVEAGETRVAVSGTIFSVTRSTKGIVVDVEHGFVVVGPRDELGVGSGRLLHEAERGSFSLDGGRSFKSLLPERTAAVSPDVGSNGLGARPSSASAPVDGAASELLTDGSTTAPATPQGRDDRRKESAQVVNDNGPLAPAPSDPVMSEASIRSSLDRCFARVEAQKREASKDDSVSVTMRSTLRLRVAEDGAINGASFSPPLRPDLQGCAVSLLSAHVDRGARTVEIPVEIRH
jgi:hypothetical protein